MSLIIDGVEHELSVVSAETVAGVITSVAADRYIQSVQVNDQEVLAKDVISGNVHIAQTDQVVVVTCTLGQLIEDTVRTAKTFTPGLLSALESVAENIRIGAMSDAGALFTDIVPGLQWTTTVLSNLASLHPGPSEVHRLAERSEELMSQLLAAWNSLDYVLIADLVDYEVVPWLETWMQLTEMFAAQINLEKLKVQ